eukprot:jgi/Chlat1/8105/Chrsp75S07598
MEGGVRLRLQWALLAAALLVCCWCGQVVEAAGGNELGFSNSIVILRDAEEEEKGEAKNENAYAAILYAGDDPRLRVLRGHEGDAQEPKVVRDAAGPGGPGESQLFVKWREVLAREDKRRNDPRFVHAMKLWAWGLTEYKRVLLDADNLFLRDVDKLFKCGDCCSSFINPCILHMGLVVLAPSNDTLMDMLARTHACAQIL